MSYCVVNHQSLHHVSLVFGATHINPNPHTHHRLPRRHKPLPPQNRPPKPHKLPHLLDKHDRKLMMSRRELHTHIRARKRKIPQPSLTSLRIRQSWLQSASGEELNPVGTAFGGGSLVLHDVVGEEGAGVVGVVLHVADEAVVLPAVGALNVGV